MVQSRVLPAPPPRWLRLLPTPRLALGVIAAIASLALVSGTGFGASTEVDTVTANVQSTISLTDPTALDAVPPVCGTSLSALNADGCSATYTAGATGTLNLGALTGSDVEARRLTWMVTTSSPTGYSLLLSNAGSGNVLQSATDSIPDMPATYVSDSAVDTATHFGVAAGDPVSDNQAAVSFGGSTWVTGGQQGEKFRGIPVAGVVIAQRATPQTNDPVSLTFAAASVSTDQPTTGAYTGLVRLTASVI